MNPVSNTFPMCAFSVGSVAGTLIIAGCASPGANSSASSSTSAMVQSISTSPSSAQSSSILLPTATSSAESTATLKSIEDENTQEVCRKAGEIFVKGSERISHHFDKISDIGDWNRAEARTRKTLTTMMRDLSIQSTSAMDERARNAILGAVLQVQAGAESAKPFDFVTGHLYSILAKMSTDCLARFS